MVEYATVVGGALNLREEKSTKSNRLTLIPNGSRVAITSHGKDWCKVVYNSYTGYAKTEYLNFESEVKDEDIIPISLSKAEAVTLFEALKLSLNK